LSGIILRAARVEEASTLTELCLRSKAVWGYDAEFLAACRAELALHPADFESSYVEAAEIDRELVGMCQLTLANERAILERLFVAPSCLGRGIGRLLYRWAEDVARSNSAAEIRIEADPGERRSIGEWEQSTSGQWRQGASPAGGFHGCESFCIKSRWKRTRARGNK
jgi:GNAT superfamily N-acetyltransferase